MTDRPARPEYGEYATPEEQAAAIGVVPEALQDMTPQAVVPGVVPPSGAPAGAVPVAALSPARRWDFVITLALLIMAAYETFSTIGAYSDLAGTLQQAYTVYGYDGTFPNVDLARHLGLVLNIVQPFALVLAVYFSVRSLRRGRVSFWIPLVAGVVVGIVTAIVFGTVVASDPNFVDFVTRSVKGS